MQITHKPSINGTTCSRSPHCKIYDTSRLSVVSCYIYKVIKFRKTAGYVTRTPKVNNEQTSRTRSPLALLTTVHILTAPLAYHLLSMPLTFLLSFFTRAPHRHPCIAEDAQMLDLANRLALA